jgi:FAD/FMN-containing dehydrogenase
MTDVFKNLSRQLKGVFPAARIEILPGARDDEHAWTIIVHPRGEGDIFKTVRIVGEEGIPLRVGGRTPDGRPPIIPGGAVRIDMTGMDRILELDDQSHLVRVQVGVSVAVLQSRLAERELMLGWSTHGETPHTLGAVFSGAVPVRWGARHESPTAGVRALKAVLPGGGVITSTPAPRRATGPDLKQLLLGTRGRLGILSEVSLRVHPWPEAQLVVVADVPVGRITGLGTVLQEQVRPHLLEIDVGSDGAAHVMASLHGTAAEVSAARSALSGALDVPMEDAPGVPPGIAPMGDDLALSWTAFAAFVEAWNAGSKPKPFRVKRMTGVGVVLSGGGAFARKKATEALGFWYASGGSSTRHLQAIKATLDPRNILGALGDGRP